MVRLVVELVLVKQLVVVMLAFKEVVVLDLQEHLLPHLILDLLLKVDHHGQLHLVGIL